MEYVERLNEANIMQGVIPSREGETIPHPEPLLSRIKAVLANGPIPYDQVLDKTGATEDEVRVAIRDWFELVAGRIVGRGEEWFWWIDPESSRGDRP